MYDSQVETPASTAVAGLRSAVDALTGLRLDGLTRDELLALTREVETQLRRVPVFEHAVTAELDSRGVARELACRDTATLLRDLLRLSPGQAKARVRAAADLGPRRGLTGETLAPLFPAVAAAQADGVISATQARIVTSTVDRLPDVVAKEHGESAEAFLTEQAAVLDPMLLGRVARRLAETLDPDGTLTEDRDRQRRRDLRIRLNRDGTGELTGRLTPACLAVWQTVLDPLAAPTPANHKSDGAGGEPDRRSPGQRMHDGLLDAGLRLLRSGTLPDCGGTPTTLLITLTADQLPHRTGLAVTGHGALISVAEALTLADETDLLPVGLNPSGGIVSYGRTRRLATPAQRRALAARDGGCSFPGCTTPAAWTQAHHITGWAEGGSTDLDNLTLLCGHHHREHHHLGWTCTMINAVPHWTPPRWIDPHQTPRRNHAHHTGAP